MVGPKRASVLLSIQMQPHLWLSRHTVFMAPPRDKPNFQQSRLEFPHRLQLHPVHQKGTLVLMARQKAQKEHQVLDGPEAQVTVTFLQRRAIYATLQGPNLSKKTQQQTNKHKCVYRYNSIQIFFYSFHECYLEFE